MTNWQNWLDKVSNSGTSEGVKKAWEVRRGRIKSPTEEESEEGYAWDRGGGPNSAKWHRMMAERHEKLSK